MVVLHTMYYDGGCYYDTTVPPSMPVFGAGSGGGSGGVAVSVHSHPVQQPAQNEDSSSSSGSDSDSSSESSGSSSDSSDNETGKVCMDHSIIPSVVRMYVMIERQSICRVILTRAYALCFILGFPVIL